MLPHPLYGDIFYTFCNIKIQELNSKSNRSLLEHHFIFYVIRMQYATWKEECRQLFPLVGSGRFVTAPVITEDGQPIQDPLVLKETDSATGLCVLSEDNSPSRMDAANKLQKVTDKTVIQWMLTLHQIGWSIMCSQSAVCLMSAIIFIYIVGKYCLCFRQNPAPQLFSSYIR